MGLFELFNNQSLKTLIKALRNEPLDIVFFNIWRKIINKKPLSPSKSYLKLYISKFIQHFSRLRGYLDFIKIRLISFKYPKITIVYAIPNRQISKNDYLKLKNQTHLLKKYNIYSYCYYDPKRNGEYLDVFDKSHYKCFEDLLINIKNLKSNYILFFDRVAYIKLKPLLQLRKNLNKINSTICYADHWEIVNDKKLHFCKPTFNWDYFLSYDFLRSPIIVKQELFNDLVYCKTLSFWNLNTSILFSIKNVEKIILRIPEFICNIPLEKKKLIQERIESRKQLIESFLNRHRIEAKVEYTSNIEVLYIDRKLSRFPKISIVIPFRNEIETTTKCVKSIINNTEYPNFEILLVSNNSDKSELDIITSFVESYKNIRLLEYNYQFNYSAINNYAVGKSTGENILFLNNDTEILNKGWLINLSKHIQRENVGAVGALLLYPDQTVQHSGVIIGVGDVAAHAHRHFPVNHNGYMNRIRSEHEVSAVTGACLLTKKHLFHKVSGFDQVNLPISNNDVDYCLKLLSLGLKIIFTPNAVLFHFESKSRKSDLSESQITRYKQEVSFMKEKWNLKYFQDKFYHPKLTKRSEDFGIIL